MRLSASSAFSRLSSRWGGRQDNGQTLRCRIPSFWRHIHPVYITHYPLVYIYTAWAFNRQATLAEGLPYMLLTFVGAFALAYACLKCYDLPVQMAHGTFLEEEIKSGKEILYLLSYFCRMTDKVPTPKVFCGRHNQITRTQMSITVSLIEEKAPMPLP